MKTRILLVDDHSLLREGLVLLETYVRFDVCGDASTAGDGLHAAGDQRPDVVLMDIELPDLSGLQATRQLVATHPECAVIVVSAYAYPEVVRSAAEAGARGFVAKGDEVRQLVAAIDTVAAGGTSFPDWAGDLPQPGSRRPDRDEWTECHLKAPAFELPSAAGAAVQLADLPSGLTALVFVSPNCPYSQQIKQQLLETPPAASHQLLCITSVADSVSPETADLDARFAARYAVLTDTTRTAMTAYKASSVPTTYLLDEDRRIVASALGPTEGMKLVARLDGDGRP